MTAVTLPVPRGLAWSVLRVHRVPLWIWTAFVAVGSGGLLWLYRLAGESRGAEGFGIVCGTGSGVPPCDDLANDIVSAYWAWLGPAATLITCLPFAAAVFAGGALIGRELENGTAALAWTQSVTPARWLAARLAVPAVLLGTGTALLSVLFRWVWSSGRQYGIYQWYGGDTFHATGPVGVAYVLLGLALGVLAGLLTRRTLSGLGLGFLATLLVQVIGGAYRFELWPKTTWTGTRVLNLPDNVVYFDRGVITAAGRQGNNHACVGSDSAADLKRCVTESGATDFYAVVHPASHYWPLQLVETGVVLTVAGLATAAAFWLLRRRTPSRG